MQSSTRELRCPRHLCVPCRMVSASLDLMVLGSLALLVSLHVVCLLVLRAVAKLTNHLGCSLRRGSLGTRRYSMSILPVSK